MPFNAKLAQINLNKSKALITNAEFPTYVFPAILFAAKTSIILINKPK